MAGALDGIRVIDFGQWIAGPLSALLRMRTAEEWDQLATQRLFPLTRIRTSAEWMGSEHTQGAGIVVPVDDPEYGSMLQPGPAVRLHGLTRTVPLARPHSGRLAKRTYSPLNLTPASVRAWLPAV